MATKSIRLSNGTDALLPESAQSASGYCKMADGTLICCGFIAGQQMSAGQTVSKVITFPMAFTEIPAITITLGTSAPGNRSCSFGSESKTGFTAYTYSSLATAGVGGFYIAMGRWK